MVEMSVSSRELLNYLYGISTMCKVTDVDSLFHAVVPVSHCPSLR